MASIVLIDDDPDVRRAIRRVLEQAGHSVLALDNGKAALASIEAEPPDLVITDMLMPDMDGVEVIGEVGSAAPGLPIIAVSGGGRVPISLLLDTAGGLGAVHTLAKPFEMQELLDMVAGVLK